MEVVYSAALERAGLCPGLSSYDASCSSLLNVTRDETIDFGEHVELQELLAIVEPIGPASTWFTNQRRTKQRTAKAVADALARKLAP